MIVYDIFERRGAIFIIYANQKEKFIMYLWEQGRAISSYRY